MRNPSMASAAPSSSSSPSKTRCCTKEGLKKGPWTAEEDELLANYVKKEGEGRWRTLPKRAGLLRCGKSCRLRWMNYLRPSVKRGQITPDEEDLILRLHRLLGNRWSLIAGRIPGRTDNEIKNYWNTHLSKKLISQGIDPRTHKPLNPNSSPEIRIPETKLNCNRSPPDPHPQTNPDPSVLEDVDNPIILEKCSNDQFNLHQGYNGVVGYDNWQNSDSLMVSRHRSHGNSNEDGEMECCTDDMFSSFLNSLINDDVFVSQAQQPQTADGIAPLLSDPIVSSSHAFGYGTLWEAAGLVPSTAGFNEDEYKRITDEVNKH